MEPIQIRQAIPPDLPEILDLIRACTLHMEFQGIDQWDQHYPSRSVFEDDIRTHSLYVGRKNERICGVLALNDRQEPGYAEVEWAHNRGKAMVVHRLAVHSAFQRQGVGARLMDFAEQLAAARGYASIRLDAFSLNPAAVALYESRGYRRAGVVTFRKRRFYCFERVVSPD
jgi:ribosomal protein S18 acetylase RimI-like enzyme